MLSRVTTRDNLFILGELKPEDFVPAATAAAFPAEGAAAESSSSSSSSSSNGRSGGGSQVDTSDEASA
jgi:hypothetical protein